MKKKRGKGNWSKLITLAIAATAMHFQGTLELWAAQSTNAAPKRNQVPNVMVLPDPVSHDLRSATSFSSVIKKISKSVVTISSTKKAKNEDEDLRNDPLFRHFFAPGARKDSGRSPREQDDSLDRSTPKELKPRIPNRSPRAQEEQSLGSGVIISSDGYIISNSHVVEDAEQVKVIFSDGDREVPARIVGFDAATDISVLKVDGTNLTPIAMTDSDNLQVGDMTLAIGNPFGVGQTVTLGIISAVGRGGFGISDYEDFIQTDASINPGNSGGALVDVEGRLIGVPTAILSRSGGNMGIGFAVPANMARDVLARIVLDGRVIRGYLGVYVQPLNAELAQAFKLQDTRGALVSGVNPNGPGFAAGLREGDIIVRMNGKPVPDNRQLRLSVARALPGSKTEFTVMRDGVQRDLAVTLGELPDEQKVARIDTLNPPTPTGRTEGLDGFTLTDVDPRLRQELRLPSGLKGAVVLNVDETSKAYQSGLRPGDIVLEVNRQKVSDAQEATRLTRAVRGRALLKVWSKGSNRYLVINADADSTSPSQ